MTYERKAFVLLSGGMDSTTCLFKAYKDFDGSVEAVSIDYGQRHRRELTFARASCDSLGIKHTILDVGNLLSGKEVLLSAESIGNLDMVHKDYSEIKGVSPSYVPFRNGLLLSAITAHAQKYVNSQVGFDNERLDDAKDLVAIYYGAHAEDAANWAYPDCTPEFNGSMANAIYTGSYNTIRLQTPLQWLEKWQIVQLGESLGVDWRNTWSCYDNGEIHCGECPTCLARKAAFLRAGVNDPTDYAA